MNICAYHGTDFIIKNSTIGSARRNSNIRPPRRVYTVAASEVGYRVDSARRTNQKRSTAQALRGGSKTFLPPYNHASGVHPGPGGGGGGARGYM
jgi:hypothetical protein